jgi:hypothetical protein
MVTILGHEVLLFEKPRLCKRGILVVVVYFLLFIIKECLCLELSCPNKWMELPSNCSSNFVRNQCLLVRHNFSDDICKLSINRNAKLRTIELRKNMLFFCNHYNLAKVMSESDILTHIEGRNCVEFIRNIECQDAIAEAMYNQFVDMLSRMDCHKPYSVSWNCTDCLVSLIYVCCVSLYFVFTYQLFILVHITVLVTDLIKSRPPTLVILSIKDIFLYLRAIIIIRKCYPVSKTYMLYCMHNVEQLR